MHAPRGHFIDGRWVSSAGPGLIPLVNPATEELIGHVSDGSAEDVDRAVAAAQTARRGEWAAMGIEDRIEVIERMGSLLQEQAEEIASLQTQSMGAPIGTTRTAVTLAVTLISSYVEAVRGVNLEFVRRDAWGQSLITREPVGVVAAIAPWNGPLPLAINKVVPALLVGCPVVIKPAPETPFETGFLADAAATAGLPPGVLNVITGGRETGEALVSHPGVDKVTFTGSTAAGRRIGAVCSERFARVSLELGGKSAAIVLPDADLSSAVPIIATGNFTMSGQICIALSRVLVPRSLHDEFVEAACEAARALIPGDPLVETTTMGPLVNRQQLERVTGFIERALSDGAKAATGGGRPDGCERGYFVEPTVLVGVHPNMEVAREEIFGPVMSVIAYDDIDEAIEIANDCDYGLHGGVYTSDPVQGLAVARRVETGTIAINTWGTLPSTPFGGIKSSGIGREKGIEGVESFLETKAFIIPSDLYDELHRSGVPEG